MLALWEMITQAQINRRRRQQPSQGFFFTICWIFVLFVSFAVRICSTDGYKSGVHNMYVVCFDEWRIWRRRSRFLSKKKKCRTVLCLLCCRFRSLWRYDAYVLGQSMLYKRGSYKPKEWFEPMALHSWGSFLSSFFKVLIDDDDFYFHLLDFVCLCLLLFSSVDSAGTMLCDFRKNLMERPQKKDSYKITCKNH